VRDATASLAFYEGRLGFKRDWTHEHAGEVIVAQVSRGDFELILNKDETRVGSGRIYFHLTDQQVESLRQEVESQGLATNARQWGMPITELRDPDGNELFFDELSKKG
jgi:catechol 2,3-dioxygenase-like lactoylglutathione lyase family enzyme